MEQRKAQRFELKLPLELIRKGSTALSEHGETRNLSSVGVLFEAGATDSLYLGWTAGSYYQVVRNRY